MTGRRAILCSVLLSLTVVSPALWSAPPPAEAPGAATKPRSRLPNHYGKLSVTADQRERIHAIQADYDGRIDELLAQIEQLRSDRNAAMEAVLTVDQRARLTQLREEQAAKRRAKSAAADE